MKPVPKRDESQVSGGVLPATIVEKPWPQPAPYPMDPCSPVTNDPLGDLKTTSGR